MFMSFQIQQIWAVYFSGVNDLRCPNCQPSLRLREVIDIGIVAKLNVSGNQIESIRKTNADVVVVNCPGGMIQIQDGLLRHKMPQKVLHLAQLLDGEI